MIYQALFDYVPNFAFVVGAYFLVRIVYLVRGRAWGVIATAGALLIALGGFLQATWKLLFATGTADIRLLSNLQFVLMAPGFVILLIVIILLARRSGKYMAPPLLAIVPWKIPFLIIMVLASLTAYAVLINIAIRRRVYGSGFGFLVAFICFMAMGGMASGEQSVARQWVEEGVNAIGQISFALGSFLLHQNFKLVPCQDKDYAGDALSSPV